MKCTFNTLLIYALITSVVNAQDPISIGLMAAASVAAGIFANYYQYHETCNGNWIALNRTGLETDLQEKLFGQHVASPIILKAVTDFMNNKNPKNPLVLSLHGWTGSGKNFMSQLIAKNIYYEGMKSKFVHLFSATSHFPHESQIETYKVQLPGWIKERVTLCERSMFIFDEVEKMHPGLIDSIKPFLDFYDKLDGVSYQKSIFIFLSNMGGDIINQVALDFWRGGRMREDIQLKDLETPLTLSIFNNRNSGFWHTSLIENNLVDFFVPFLPLEYRHVVQCGLAEMAAKDQKQDKDKVNRMARDLSYLPEEEKIFSRSGCKTVAKKLAFY